jgi:hypothetical protein
MQDTDLSTGKLRALTADELDLVSGGNAAVIAVAAALVIGVTLVVGYEAYKAADQTVKDANNKNAATDAALKH